MGRNYFRNLQQSGRVNYESTSNNNYKEPFRISDSRLLVGKYKGKRLTDLDNLSYLRWMLRSVSMSTQHKNILKNHIHYIVG